MHPNVYSLSVFASSGVSAGVISVLATDGIPFVFGESVVIVGVDDGVFALGERDAAEGVAVANAAIYEGQPD